MPRIDYYEWEDMPCRIIQDETGARRAEIYVSGTGFAPTSVSNLLRQGYLISEKQFKQMVIECAASSRDEASDV